MISPKIISLCLPLVLLACSGKTETAASSLSYEVTGGRGIMHYVHVQSDDSIEKGEFFKASKALCKHQDICIVMFWDDKELMPPASEPLTDDHVAAKVAHYNWNKYTRLERVAVCAVDGC